MKRSAGKRRARWGRCERIVWAGGNASGGRLDGPGLRVARQRPVSNKARELGDGGGEAAGAGNLAKAGAGGRSGQARA